MEEEVHSNVQGVSKHGCGKGHYNFPHYVLQWKDTSRSIMWKIYKGKCIVLLAHKSLETHDKLCDILSYPIRRLVDFYFSL